MKVDVSDELLLPEVKGREQELGVEDLPFLWDQYCKDGYKHVVKIRLFKQYWKVMKSLLLPQPGAVVLDGGCGTGAMFSLILERIGANKIMAVDWSSKMLEQAQEVAAQLLDGFFPEVFEFEQIDLTEPYPWQDNRFDAEVYSISLYYLPYRGWEDALKEAYRTLKPGGYLYASIMFKGWDFPAMIKKNIPRELLANLYRCIKAAGVKNTARKLHTYVEKGVIEYPTREEFLNSLVRLGFIEVVQKKIFQGGGMAIRAKKSKG